ncbi:MAG: endonuclease/exonuclease/phosphatase family protein [Polyangiales bacterium]|jgi:endonuclease/exonuclease/phosphatase family metal-dependent hydrolase
MNRSLIVLSTLALALGCGDSTGENATSRAPEEVIVDSFNVALAGAFIPYEAERRQPIADAIAAHDADVLCLQEVWTQADKELIRDTAAQTYPYFAFFENNLDTPLDDPTDQQGQIPPAPTTVPCPDQFFDGEELTIKQQMEDAIDCVRDNCSTIPDSDEGRTTSADCAADNCSIAVLPLLFGTDPQHQRCYACVIPQLPSATFAEMRASCPTVVNQDLAFGGQNGVMILSRHPLKNAENWVVPGTWNRRSILRATVELPNGAELDTYCNHLTPIFSIPPSGINTFPYTGQYGDGMTGPEGWIAEQELQVQKLINYVASKSNNRPAVILGDFNSGLGYPEQDIVGESEETFNMLAAAYTPAYTADYTPQCTFCTSNPVTDTQFSIWYDHIFLSNLPLSAVKETARIFDQDVVPVEGDMLVPLSDHFGMRSVIVVP